MALKVPSSRAISGKPKQRGTLRALGRCGIGRTNTLPDRPEIRTTPSRTSCRSRRSKTDGYSHSRSGAGRRLQQAWQAQGAQYRRQGRQDRRPRHQGSACRNTVPVGFEGGQMP